MFGGTQQCEMRERDNYTLTDLIAFDRSRDVLNGIVPHIRKYIDLVRPTDSNSRTYTTGLLKSTLNHAISNPTASNPLQNWGNAMCIPFLDWTIMLLDFQHKMNVVIHDIPHIYGVLARVNFALSGGIPDEDCTPQFSYRQLLAMFAKVNYLGYQPGHFFLLDNPQGELENAKEAVVDWVGGICAKIRLLTTPERDVIRQFVLDANKSGEVVTIDETESSPASTATSRRAEVVDVCSSSDDEDDSRSQATVSSVSTPSKSFSFGSNVAVQPSIEERDILIKMVCKIFLKFAVFFIFYYLCLRLVC
jgi:hypothetical protein